MLSRLIINYVLLDSENGGGYCQQKEFVTDGGPRCGFVISAIFAHTYIVTPSLRTRNQWRHIYRLDLFVKIPNKVRLAADLAAPD
jgi:hypothetical protein